MSEVRRSFLRKLLVPLWLKPESALWYAHELAAVTEFLQEGFAQPSLEIGCMDGTNSFLILGGEFGHRYDVYKEVTWTPESIHWQSLKEDYFNTYKDQVDPPDVRVPPHSRFSVGLSWRTAHVVKANRLGIYDRMVDHDPNVPLTMFPDQSFATIWAPNLYWIENLAGVCREITRILHPKNGRMVTILPDTSQLEHLLFPYAEQTDREWIKDLDRGRYGNAARQARTLAQWTTFFAEAGLKISRRAEFLPSVVGRVYDIGLRPMFPVFMHIYETLLKTAPDELLAIKQQWIDTAYHFLAPLCDDGWMDRMGIKKVWHLFEVTPR